MRKALARLFPMFAMASLAEQSYPQAIDVQPVYHGQFKPRKKEFTTHLTKKQRKARIRAKMAKQSRKVNYRNAKR